jgi:hypothetical protein
LRYHYQEGKVVIEIYSKSPVYNNLNGPGVNIKGSLIYINLTCPGIASGNKNKKKGRL